MSKLNRHLYLRSGIWWTRIMRGGVEVRESTHCPKSEVVSARNIRNERLARMAEDHVGLERLADPMLLGALIRSYLEEECRSYDREKGGEQPGSKRSADSDHCSAGRILRHMDGKRSAALVDREALLDLAKKIEREVPMPKPGTRRKSAAFLRRVFSWAVENRKKTGVNRSPFAELSRADRARVFPRVGKRAYLYTAEQLCQLYEILPSWSSRFTRFAVHTGMRFEEIATLTWGNVDLDRKAAHVEERYAKSKKARDVALGDVACSILEKIRPENPAATDRVVLGRTGKPVRSIRTAFDNAVSHVWAPTTPDEPRPRFHDLRKTGATRVESVSSHAVARAFLGHSDRDVTDSYIVATLEAVREAVNRAAIAIDGTMLPGVVRFEPKTAQKTAQRPKAEVS